MRISDWSSDVCSSDLAHQVVPNPPLPVVAGTAARVERDFVAAGSFSLDARVLIEPNAVPQDDIKAPPRVLAQRTGLARLAYWLVGPHRSSHSATLPSVGCPSWPCAPESAERNRSARPRA